jgi:hypothetical protein
MILDGDGEAFLIDGKLEVRLVLSQSPEVGLWEAFLVSDLVSGE